MTAPLPDLVQGIPRSRRIGIVIGIGVVFVIGESVAKRYGWPALNHYLAYPEPSEALRRFKRVMGVLGLGLLPVVAYMGWMAIRIIRSKQFPYPGMSVWRDTRIARGRSAVLRGWALAGCALLVLGLAFFAAYIPYGMERNGHVRRSTESTQ